MTEPATCSTIRWNGEPLCDSAYTKLEEEGFLVIDGVVPPELCDLAKSKLIATDAQIKEALGHTRSNKTLRLINKFDPFFNGFLEYRPFLNLIDRFLGPQAVVRFLQGMIFQPVDDSVEPSDLPDNLDFHQNFPHFSANKHLTLEFLYELTDRSAEDASFVLVPESHRWQEKPSLELLEELGQEIAVPKGGLLALFGTTWHKEKKNHSKQPAYYITLQVSNPFIRPHFDFYRALGKDTFESLPPRSRTLLGIDTRLPASIEEFYS